MGSERKRGLCAGCFSSVQQTGKNFTTFEQLSTVCIEEIWRVVSVFGRKKYILTATKNTKNHHHQEQPSHIDNCLDRV